MRSGNALRLAAVDGHARRAGLAAGMTLADARARCPALVTLPHEPEADARALDRLAERMARFTPMVAVDPPDGVLLDITGCAHLFGGEAKLVEMAAADCPYTARHALADHAAAARALARFGKAGEVDVRALPIAALELPEEALRGLTRAGLGTIGDLARRPMSALAARFGEAVVTRLRRILGEVDSPVAPRRSMAPIRAEARFAEPIARTEDALEVIEDLLEQASRQMGQRREGGRCFEVALERSDGARRLLAVETGLPVRDPAVVMRLLRERIDTLADPLDPGFGFDAITLAVPRSEPLASRQTGLDGDEGELEDSIGALIDRLGTRLGRNSVLCLQPCDTHRPEAAQRMLPAGGGAAISWPAPGDTPTEPPPRPLWLFDPPQPVEVIAGVPDGPPQRFRWRGHLHEVSLAEGPERIAGEWWRHAQGHLPGPPPDNAGLTRDYYRIEDGEGRRFWIFRHGLFSERPDPRWYLHGLFP